MGEFGIELPRGWRTMLAKAVAALDQADSAAPALLQPQLHRQLAEVRSLTEQMAEVERQIASWKRGQEECERIAAIPGVGLLTATAAAHAPIFLLRRLDPISSRSSRQSMKARSAG